jgi:hypothetical protein
MTDEKDGLEVGYLPAPLLLKILDGQLVKAAIKLDELLGQTTVGHFGAYILTLGFYPGSDRNRAAARAERRGLSVEKAKADVDFYRASVATIAALPENGGVRLSVGGSILARKLAGFSDHFSHVTRGRLHTVKTTPEWGGVNGRAALNLYGALLAPVSEDMLRQYLNDFQLEPVAVVPTRGTRLTADALLKELLGG